ncbi:MAG: hypothetical protein H0T46_27195 [Deltaproteobacteria bacterium]|nr:hypothetical protein [Deltaproteobacteria bacterium]
MNSTTLLTTIVLALCVSACSKKEDKGDPTSSGASASPSPSTPGATPVAGTPAAAGEDSVVAFARTLDEDKVKKILVYEQEMVQHVDLLVGAAGAMASGGTKAISRDERYKKLGDLTTAAIAKAGITQQDVGSFTQLTSELWAKEMALGGYRQKIADNAPKAEKWKAIEAEAEKLEGGRRFQFLQDRNADRPMGDEEVKIYQAQLAELDEDRKAFAAKYGAPTLALLDKYREPFVAIREKQMAAMMGK